MMTVTVRCESLFVMYLSYLINKLLKYLHIAHAINIAVGWRVGKRSPKCKYGVVIQNYGVARVARVALM